MNFLCNPNNIVIAGSAQLKYSLYFFKFIAFLSFSTPSLIPIPSWLKRLSFRSLMDKVSPTELKMNPLPLVDT